MDYKLMQMRYGALLVLCLAIGLVALAYLFSPAKHMSQLEGGEPFTTAPSAYTIEGLGLRGEAWVKYPDYNRGLGIIALLSFSAAILTGGIMCDERYYFSGNSGQEQRL